MTYTVQRGDSLSLIAQKVYGDLHRWSEIFEANSWLKDPNSIQVGQVLQIPNAESGRVITPPGLPNNVTQTQVLPYNVKESSTGGASKINFSNPLILVAIAGGLSLLLITIFSGKKQESIVIEPQTGEINV